MPAARPSSTRPQSKETRGKRSMGETDARDDDDKIVVSPPRPVKPAYVFTESSWLINLDQVACAKLKGTDGKLEEVDLWFNGQNWPNQGLTLSGKDADQVVNCVFRGSRIKRHFVQEEMDSTD
jgi:hypothetical protein